MVDLSFKYQDTISYLARQSPFTPDAAVILGSGLGNFADSIEKIKSLPTSKIPQFPAASVEGHKGIIHFSKIENKKFLLFQGRIHFYEGYSLSDCILPVVLAKKLGCRTIIFTNAAGGINKNFIPGDLMLVESFNSINIKKELTKLLGLSNIEIKNNFLNCPSPRINNIFKETSKELGIKLHLGNYWYTKGPSYETPAEIEMIRRFGGDAAGMSTVYEAVFASTVNLETSVISCITNMASGISNQRLSHSEVTETAKLASEKFTLLLKTALSKL